MVELVLTTPPFCGIRQRLLLSLSGVHRGGHYRLLGKKLSCIAQCLTGPMWPLSHGLPQKTARKTAWEHPSHDTPRAFAACCERFSAIFDESGVWLLLNWRGSVHGLNKVLLGEH